MKRFLAGLEIALGASILFCALGGIACYFFRDDIDSLKRGYLGNYILAYVGLFFPLDVMLIFDGIDRWTKGR